MVLKYLVLLLFAVSAYAETSKTTATTPPPVGAGTLYGQFSLSSWQDAITLNTTGQASSRLIQTTTALCPGVGFRKAISAYASWDINGCAFYGTADINNDATAATVTNYSSKNNTVYGLQSAVGILFNPGGIKHQIGIEIPFLLRHSSPSSAGIGTSFSSTTALQTGIELDTRFYSKNSFCVDPKLAWFQTTHTMLWSLNFGMDL
jgi:hypothetical protein